MFECKIVFLFSYVAKGVAFDNPLPAIFTFQYFKNEGERGGAQEPKGGPLFCFIH